MEMAPNPGAQLRAWRDELKLSGREVATAAGISATYLVQLEVGTNGGAPSERVLQGLARALGRTEAEVMELYGRKRCEACGRGCACEAST